MFPQGFSTPPVEDLARLSDEELVNALRVLQDESSHAEKSAAADALKETIHDLQVHRYELEMQNRALREMQGELEESVGRYADLYEHLPIGYVSLTTSGKVMEANPAAARLMRRDARGLVGGYIRSFFHAADAAGLAQHLGACAESRDACRFEGRVRNEDGTFRHVQLCSRRSPVTQGTEPIIRTAITDISELKETQRALEDLNREQNAFNDSISHDLRAPLTTIANFGKIVLEEHAIEEGTRDMVKRMQSAAVRMEGMLRQMLDYNRIAREPVHTRVVEVGELFDVLLIEHRGMITFRKAEVEIVRPLPRVVCCRELMLQVLANLLDNALKFTPPGQPPRIRLSAEVSDAIGVAVIKVADRGIGIDPRHADRLFQVFERFTPRHQFPGAGMGLAIVKRAVERMNGRVWLETQVEQGCCFCVELPLG